MNLPIVKLIHPYGEMINRGFAAQINKNRDLILDLSKDDKLVHYIQEQDSKLTLILSGRIYYQKQLLERFTYLKAYKDSPQTQLVLTLFKEEGIESLKSLEGEYSLVIYDPQQKKLLLQRDPMGSYPLYWTIRGEDIFLGSNLTYLAKKTNAAINPDYLASFLMFPYAFCELYTQITSYENIQRVLPGNLVEINIDKKVKILDEFNWQERIIPIGNITLQEAGEQFRKIFSDAIYERLQFGKNAAHLSGGMDSSSVVALAKNLTEQEQPLITISLVYELSTLAKETEYIKNVLEQGGNIEPHFIKADQHLDFQWSQIPEHDEPYAGLFHLAMEKSIVELASSLGVDTIFTGTGSELITESNRHHLSDLLAQGEISQSLNLARRWAEARNQSPWSILWEYGLSPVIPFFLKGGIFAMFRDGYGQWPKLGQFVIPPWIKPEFAKQYKMRQKPSEIFNHKYSTRERYFDLLALRASAGNWSAWYLANPCNIHITQPFLDPRLITYSLSLPRAIREVPGLPKPLLQEAMRDILPLTILKRRYKGNFNEVYWKGFNQNLPILEELAKNSPSQNIFDRAQLIEVMREHAIGVGDIPSGSRISSSLAVMAWLKNRA